MLLSDEHIKEFQEMYFEEFGKSISKEVAYESAVKLITLVELTSRPLINEDLLNVEKSRKELKEKVRLIKKENY